MVYVNKEQQRSHDAFLAKIRIIKVFPCCGEPVRIHNYIYISGSRCAWWQKTTVTLAAHARRGLVIMPCTIIIDKLPYNYIGSSFCCCIILLIHPRAQTLLIKNRIYVIILGTVL